MLSLNILSLLQKQPFALHSFESIQLANLLPQTADQAKDYVPSLKTNWGDADDDLQALMDGLARVASLPGDIQ